MKPRHLEKLSDFFTRVLHSDPIISKKVPGPNPWEPSFCNVAKNLPVDLNILYSFDGYQKKRLDSLVPEIESLGQFGPQVVADQRVAHRHTLT